MKKIKLLLLALLLATLNINAQESDNLVFHITQTFTQEHGEIDDVSYVDFWVTGTKTEFLIPHMGYKVALVKIIADGHIMKSGGKIYAWEAILIDDENIKTPIEFAVMFSEGSTSLVFDFLDGIQVFYTADKIY